MLVTMATPISSHVKDKNSIFTARDEDMIFQEIKGNIFVFHQYLYNKMFFIVLGSSFIAEMLHSTLITETCLTTSTVVC